jgi:hypothetical protein
VPSAAYAGNTTLDRSVAHLNIEHYKRLLEHETDQKRRELLLRLLAEEEAKLTKPPHPDRKRQTK